MPDAIYRWAVRSLVATVAAWWLAAVAWGVLGWSLGPYVHDAATLLIVSVVDAVVALFIIVGRHM